MSNNVDYLYEDPVISNQKFVCISILTPKNFKETTTMHTLKVRGSFDTYEEAAKRAEYLRNIDSNINVYVGEVGKWLPFDDDPEHAKDHNYQNKRLNDMMKGYLENQEKAKEHHEQRKNQMIMEALKENEEKAKKNTENNKLMDDSSKVTVESSDSNINKVVNTNLSESVNTKLALEENSLPVKEVQESSVCVNKKSELIEKETSIKMQEKDITEDKANLQKTQDEYNKHQQKTEKIRKELDEARKIYESMLAAEPKR